MTILLIIVKIIFILNMIIAYIGVIGQLIGIIKDDIKEKAYFESIALIGLLPLISTIPIGAGLALWIFWEI